MTAPLVGLTGNIASGKSTVARMFTDLGIPVVDADQVAREVVLPGSEAHGDIVAAFGKDMLMPDGSIDRAKLGALVFANDEARRTLNGITHPRIAEASWGKLSALAATNVRYVIYDATLIVENRLQGMFAALIVVTTPESTQIARIRARDGLTEQEARARIAAQLPASEKEKVATFVIVNDGDEAMLRAKVALVHHKLSASLVP